VRTAMIRYRVKAELAAENERLVKQVFEQLEREQPAGLRYATFKLADGVSFMHVVVDDAADGTSTLQKIPAFREFIAAINERVEEQPVRTELAVIGSYVSTDLHFSTVPLPSQH
jgi:hypothetical protein